MRLRVAALAFVASMLLGNSMNLYAVKLEACQFFFEAEGKPDATQTERVTMRGFFNIDRQAQTIDADANLVSILFWDGTKSKQTIRGPQFGQGKILGQDIRRISDETGIIYFPDSEDTFTFDLSRHAITTFHNNAPPYPVLRSDVQCRTLLGNWTEVVFPGVGEVPIGRMQLAKHVPGLKRIGSLSQNVTDDTEGAVVTYEMDVPEATACFYTAKNPSDACESGAVTLHPGERQKVPLSVPGPCCPPS